MKTPTRSPIGFKAALGDAAVADFALGDDSAGPADRDTRALDFGDRFSPAADGATCGLALDRALDPDDEAAGPEASAQAAGIEEIAAPMPNATASPPTRPT